MGISTTCCLYAFLVPLQASNPTLATCMAQYDSPLCRAKQLERLRHVKSKLLVTNWAFAFFSWNFKKYIYIYISFEELLVSYASSLLRVAPCIPALFVFKNECANAPEGLQNWQAHGFLSCQRINHSAPFTCKPPWKICDRQVNFRWTNGVCQINISSKHPISLYWLVNRGSKYWGVVIPNTIGQYKSSMLSNNDFCYSLVQHGQPEAELGLFGATKLAPCMPGGPQAAFL